MGEKTQPKFRPTNRSEKLYKENDRDEPQEVKLNN